MGTEHSDRGKFRDRSIFHDPFRFARLLKPLMTIDPLAVANVYGANVGIEVGLTDGAGLGTGVGLAVGNPLGF